MTELDLRQFTGTTKWYRHGMFRFMTYTDGVQYVAENAGAYWLLDIVGSCQMLKEVKQESFQHWKLVVNREDDSAVVTCDDGNGAIVYTQDIEWTDFPLDEMRFFYSSNVLMLPSEY